MYAGMAKAEGTWSSVIVAVNFFWGIIIFQEHVKSLSETLAAFTTLTIGLIGMSTAGSSAGRRGSGNGNGNGDGKDSDKHRTTRELNKTTGGVYMNGTEYSNDDGFGDVEMLSEDDHDDMEDDETFDGTVNDTVGGGGGPQEPLLKKDNKSFRRDGHPETPIRQSSGVAHHRQRRRGLSKESAKKRPTATSKSNSSVPVNSTGAPSKSKSIVSSITPPSSGGLDFMSVEVGAGGIGNKDHGSNAFDEEDNDNKKEMMTSGNRDKDGVIVLSPNLIVSKVNAGIIAAAINGLMGGTSMVPLHYAAQEGFQGAGFFFSYASGAMIVNTAVFVFVFAKRLFEKRGSWSEAYHAMPQWHVKELWWPGLVSGVLFSAGMFGSIVTVGFLGQGIGNSFVQCKILISGLWGILYYKEIKGGGVYRWFGSAALAVSGILLLSYEHIK